MSSIVDNLLVVQSLDQRIMRLQQESRDVPARKKAIDATLNEHRRRLAAQKENLKKVAAGTADIEGQIDSHREQIARYRKQQLEIKSNEQYRALEKEISDLDSRISGLEDRELELLEEIDKQKAVVAELERDLQEEESVVTEDMKALDERATAIEQEIEAVKERRRQAAENIDPAILKRYARIINHLRDAAIVPVENGSCGGCHIKMPPQTAKEAKDLTGLTFCDYCGRILYAKR